MALETPHSEVCDRGTVATAEIAHSANGHQVGAPPHPWQELLSQASYRQPEETPPAIANPVVGTVAGIAEPGEVVVQFRGNPCAEPVSARVCRSVVALQAGDSVLLVFENGDLSKPIVIDALRESPALAQLSPVSFEIDGERLVYTAQKEIVLRCGKASIQLLSDGSVRIRGTELLNRASGTNRIRGGNVQIN
jgi:hypothetical protein